MKKRNEYAVFKEYLLEDCPHPLIGKGLVRKKCICFRHGISYVLKQKLRKKAIKYASLDLRESKIKAYDLSNSQLEKLIKKKESKIKKEWRFTILKASLLPLLFFT